ncbi:glycerophosphodiester phosphodiesterase family protein [Parerythrobacter aurantius]|uniref:glycerophosphodiester phosphodiesterase family protein n=1 Tax=Parerythrobacter aurantius TaxID=3127706 RepID=UPI003250E1F1
MNSWLRVAGMGLAIAFLAYTVVNASWLAAKPSGVPMLVAHRGIGQLSYASGKAANDCSARGIDEPYHLLIDNTVDAARRAVQLGAHLVSLDVTKSRDDEIVFFADAALDCRTDGTGPVRGKTLTELKALDMGYGYTANGLSFPLRGRGTGKMATLAEMHAFTPRRTRILYRFTADEAGDADLLAKRLREAGRDPVEARDAFYGEPAAVARIRQLFPKAWAWTREEAWQCTSDYRLTGWTGFLPESCKGKTMLVPLDSQWTLWGWPNRLIQRMEEHGGKIVVVESYDEGAPLRGLTLPEQLGDIPRSFNGFILVEDGFTVIPARVPRFDNRRQQEVDAAEAALERRRAL